MDKTAEYKTDLLNLETVEGPNQKSGFAFLAVAWFFLLSFSYQVVLSETSSVNLLWIDYVLLGKVVLICLSFLFYACVPRLKSKNWLSRILIVSAFAQSLFVAIEVSQQAHMYKVVLLFLLLAAINYSGPFVKWTLWYLPATLFALSTPYIFAGLSGGKETLFLTTDKTITMNDGLALLSLAVCILTAWLNARSYKAFLVNQNLKQTLEKVSKRAERGDIAKQVAHDIRSPLTALCMIESRDYMPADHRDLLKSAIQRIDDNCEKILSKGREPSSSKRATAIDTVVIDVVTEKAMVHPNLRFELIDDPANRPYVSVVDGALATNMISNLMNNAIDAVSGSDGHIKVKIEKGDGANKIEITDNGCGMSKGLIRKLGRKGFSWGKRNKKDSGFGLGVASAMQWVKEWGGKIQYKSEPGKGTSVLVSLPSAF